MRLDEAEGGIWAVEGRSKFIRNIFMQIYKIGQYFFEGMSLASFYWPKQLHQIEKDSPPFVGRSCIHKYLLLHPNRYKDEELEFYERRKGYKSWILDFEECLIDFR